MSKLLTIAELAREIDLTPATLRAWEARHGFPHPSRGAGGHRRYRPDDLEAIRSVLAARRSGATLRAAIARVQAAGPEPATSVFAALRRGPRRIETRQASKRAMVALSRALEDECSTRAEQGLLVGAFQKRRFYAQAEERWRDLTRPARLAVVFADFARVRRPGDGPAEVPIARDLPFEQEWAIVYLAPRNSALLLGRELPGAAAVDPERRFEFVWSAQPELVLQALEAAVHLAEQTAPAVASELASELASFPGPLALDPEFVTALTNRMVAYLDPLPYTT